MVQPAVEHRFPHAKVGRKFQTLGPQTLHQPANGPQEGVLSSPAPLNPIDP